MFNTRGYQKVKVQTLLVKYQPMKEHESILVFGKGRVKYNPIMQQRSKSAQERLKYVHLQNIKAIKEI